jgi:hypothetical protein
MPANSAPPLFLAVAGYIRKAGRVGQDHNLIWSFDKGFAKVQLVKLLTCVYCLSYAYQAFLLLLLRKQLCLTRCCDDHHFQSCRWVPLRQACSQSLTLQNG